MSFYYGPSSPPPDDEDDEKFRFRDAAGLVFALFKVLVVPFTIILGGLIVLGTLFWLFTVNLALGYVVLAVGLSALIARAVWDSKHPKAKKE
jgi:hypothetical protein